MQKVAQALGLRGYARIDAFMHVKTGELIIIEANTTPGLTPSTVIYHQALTEKPPMYPTEFLEKIVLNSQKIIVTNVTLKKLKLTQSVWKHTENIKKVS